MTLADFKQVNTTAAWDRLPPPPYTVQMWMADAESLTAEDATASSFDELHLAMMSFVRIMLPAKKGLSAVVLDGLAAPVFGYYGPTWVWDRYQGPAWCGCGFGFQWLRAWTGISEDDIEKWELTARLEGAG